MIPLTQKKQTLSKKSRITLLLSTSSSPLLSLHWKPSHHFQLSAYFTCLSGHCKPVPVSQHGKAWSRRLAALTLAHQCTCAHHHTPWSPQTPLPALLPTSRLCINSPQAWRRILRLPGVFQDSDCETRKIRQPSKWTSLFIHLWILSLRKHLLT